MALTSYSTGDALTAKAWSKILAHEAAGNRFFKEFQGTGTDNLIQIKEETGKNKGDQVTFGLRNLLTGDGITSDGTLEGNEEALVTYSDAVKLDQLRHAVRSSGEMSEQRVPFSVREEAMSGLADWIGERLDTVLFNHLAGNLPSNSTATTYGLKTGTQFTLGNVITACSTGRQIWSSVSGAITTDENLTSTDVMHLGLIDFAVEKAKTLDSTGNPRIRPLADGNYVCFMSPGQVKQVRTSTSTGQWLDIQKSMMTGDGSKGSKILKGGEYLGLYNGVHLYESSYIPRGYHGTTRAIDTDTRRAVFCGAQAAVLAFGQKYSLDNMNWVEKRFDYENQLGVATRTISGLKKTVFNSKDFGVIVISTYCAT